MYHSCLPSKGSPCPHSPTPTLHFILPGQTSPRLTPRQLLPGSPTPNRYGSKTSRNRPLKYRFYLQRHGRGKASIEENHLEFSKTSLTIRLHWTKGPGRKTSSMFLRLQRGAEPGTQRIRSINIYSKDKMLVTEHFGVLNR